jgi:hypothetical protein
MHEHRSVAEEIQEWIECASANTGIPLRIVSNEEAKTILELIGERYVRDINGSWWWEHLKLPYSHFDRTAVKLSHVLPSVEAIVYLVPNYPRNEGPFFSLQAVHVEAILNDCPLFEYSILSADGSWFLTESHHDVIYVSRSAGGPDKIS